MTTTLVDNTQLRAAVLRSGRALRDLDAELGVSQHRTARALGIAKSFRYANGQKITFRQRRVSYAFAERLVQALGIDPWEVGI